MIVDEQNQYGRFKMAAVRKSKYQPTQMRYVFPKITNNMLNIQIYKNP